MTPARLGWTAGGLAAGLLVGGLLAAMLDSFLGRRS